MTWRPLEGDVPQPTSMAEALNRLTKKLGSADAGTMKSLFDDWPIMVGETIAQNVSPVSLKDGVLVVQTPDPVWARQLSFMTANLQSQLNEGLGAEVVKSIDVRVRR